MAKKLTTEEFLEKARGVHGDRYEYPGLIYTNHRTKIRIKCHQHGIFAQTCNSHLRGNGCPRCADELHGDKTRGTQESFVKKARDVHGDRYDYSRAEYRGNHASITIGCRVHGFFEQEANNHLRGADCLKCSRESSARQRTSSMNEFISKANEVHSSKYTYAGEYVNNHTKVQITCREHGVTFLQTPNSHLNGNGCFICGTRDNAIKRRMSPEAWKQRADEVHGNKYDYSKVAYETSNSKVTIICPAHKKPTEFIQLAKNHLMGWGCPECKKVTLRELHSIDHDEFIRRARKRHGNRYNYDDTVYVNSLTKVSIRCRKHGVFSQLPANHIKISGCPRCCESRGEADVQKLLTVLGVEFVRQYKIPECKNKKALPFDFAILKEGELQMLIEYQGEQHYILTRRPGAEKLLENGRKRDAIKKEFCKANGIPLLIIPYWDKENIPSIISEVLTDYPLYQAS